MVAYGAIKFVKLVPVNGPTELIPLAVTDKDDTLHVPVIANPGPDILIPVFVRYRPVPLVDTVTPSVPFKVVFP